MERNFKGELSAIKLRLDYGRITFDEAQVEAQPIIDDMNEVVKTVAKKFNKKPYKFTFIGLLGR